jgi:predicted ATP-grasp superfamily ATP-dependent carboligase
MPAVLVLDAQLRNSLAVIRSLGKAGIKITAGEDTRIATGMFSKYCQKTIVYPSPNNENKFVEYLLDHLKTNHYDAIFPISDATIIPIVKNIEKFSKYTIIPYPDYKILHNAVDKSETLRAAMINDIPCPKTYFIKNILELETINNSINYPVIIKPRISFGSRGICLCKSSDDLLKKYEQISKQYVSPLIQEYIPNGGQLGVYTILNFDSEPRAVSVQRRIRSYPASGGPSTFRETVDNPELIEIAYRLLKALKWTGVAMVEFRVDARDNIPKLMEINPRFWGSLQLSILSGVDFPLLLFKLYTEGDIEPVTTYQKGVKCRWLLPGDILWYLSTPNKIKNLPAFLQYHQDDIISLSDPGPTLGFTLAALRYLFDINMWKFILRKPIEER